MVESHDHVASHHPPDSLTPLPRELSGFVAALADRYAIERELGRGGMATVYLARDLKHDRRVALKVLNPELGAVLGVERFLAEIKVTANLQHPNLLPLFDSGEATGLLFYVMPYVEGESLRARLEREKQLPVDEAVHIAVAVANALEYAHQHGVIHRDLKPENILLQSGQPVVADFGIALAVSNAGGARITQTGLSLGTPQYMSPEQATGDRVIDARTDIYSLGAMLYEMLTGEPPHTGNTAQAIIARLMTEEPRPLTHVRRAVPAHVDIAVRRALAKLPADRFVSAHQLADALQTAGIVSGERGGATGVGSTEWRPWRARVRSRAGAALALLGGTLALAGIVAAALAWQATRRAVPPLLQLTLNYPSGNPDLGRFGVSPDGARFAFATDGGIAVRDSGGRDYRLLAGTQGAESPVFSPDGEWIAFHTRGLLRKISVRGGSALSLVARDSLLASRIDWGEDGTIVFESGNRLYLIAPSGGTPRALPGTRNAKSPHLMPDGRGVLYTDQQRGSRLMYYDVASDSAFELVPEAVDGRYVAGHVVYGHPDGGLLAVLFDAKRRAVAGNPIPIVSDIQQQGAVAPFVVTQGGALAYRAGKLPEYRLLLAEPRGRIDTLPLAPSVLAYARFSPDGGTLALTIGATRGTNRYTAIYDLALGTVSRFTMEGGGHAPVWSPDGSRLVFSAESEETDGEDLFVQGIDRQARPIHLFRSANDEHATAWPSDTMLVFSHNSAPRTLLGPALRGSIGIVNPVKPNITPRPYLDTPWSTADAVVSRDGRYAAFTSMESGTSEIYIRPFPSAVSGQQWKVSSGGGQRARWSRDGRTVYYQGNDDNSIYAVHINPGPPLTLGARETVLTLPGLGAAWDVDPSRRMVLSQAVGFAEAQIVVITNWVDHFLRGTRTPQ